MDKFCVIYFIRVEQLSVVSPYMYMCIVSSLCFVPVFYLDHFLLPLIVLLSVFYPVSMYYINQGVHHSTR